MLHGGPGYQDVVIGLHNGHKYLRTLRQGKKFVRLDAICLGLYFPVSIPSIASGCDSFQRVPSALRPPGRPLRASRPMLGEARPFPPVVWWDLQV
jgi:hypothetical protein